MLQSGNVVFSARRRAEAAVAKLVASTIAEASGSTARVLVRSAAELKAVAAKNPFVAGAARRATRRRSTSRSSRRRRRRPPSAKLDPDRSPPDAFDVRGREVYLSYPNGSGRTKLNLAYLERVLGVEGTARNWRTVRRLAELLEG